MPDFSKGKIYRIIDLATNKQYIGSTTLSLSLRLNKHVQDYKLYLVDKFHMLASFNVLRNNNYEIHLIEEYPCTTKQELLNRERYYQSTMPNVNKNRAGVMMALGNQYQNDYYLRNKDNINVKCTCECGATFIKRQTQRHLLSEKHKRHTNIINTA